MQYHLYKPRKGVSDVLFTCSNHLIWISVLNRFIQILENRLSFRLQIKQPLSDYFTLTQICTNEVTNLNKESHSLQDNILIIKNRLACNNWKSWQILRCDHIRELRVSKRQIQTSSKKKEKKQTNSTVHQVDQVSNKTRADFQYKMKITELVSHQPE